MSTTRNVVVLVGSLRKASNTLLLAKELIAFAPPELALKIIEIGDLPFFNEDVEAEGPPQVWVSFRNAIRDCDAVLFVTPEYNRSIPAALKNAIDVGSRPHRLSVWNGKPAAVISASLVGTGGFGVSHHLRQSLVGINAAAMPQPDVYLTGALFDESGKIANEGTRTRLKTYLKAFAKWIDLIRQPDTASLSAAWTDGLDFHY